MLKYVVMTKPTTELPDSCHPLEPHQVPSDPEALFEALAGLTEGAELELGQQHAAYQFTLALAEADLPPKERETAHRLIEVVYGQLLDLGRGGRKDNALAYRRAYGRALKRRDKQPIGRPPELYFDQVIDPDVSPR